MFHIYWARIELFSTHGVREPFFNFKFDDGTFYNCAPQSGHPLDRCGWIIFNAGSLPMPWKPMTRPDNYFGPELPQCGSGPVFLKLDGPPVAEGRVVYIYMGGEEVGIMNDAEMALIDAFSNDFVLGTEGNWDFGAGDIAVDSLADWTTRDRCTFVHN